MNLRFYAFASFAFAVAVSLAVSVLHSMAANKCEQPFKVTVTGYIGTMEVSSSSLKEPQKAKLIQLIESSEILEKAETINVDFLQGHSLTAHLIEVTCNGSHHVAAFTDLPSKYKELVSLVLTSGYKLPESSQTSTSSQVDATKSSEALQRLTKDNVPFKLELLQTGGFAGVHNTSSVDSSNLTAEARSQIVKAIAESGLLSKPFIAPKKTFVVSDGFHEAIKFEFDGAVRGARYDVPGSDNAALEHLGSLIKKYDSSRPQEAAH